MWLQSRATKGSKLAGSPQSRPREQLELEEDDYEGNDDKNFEQIGKGKCLPPYGSSTLNLLISSTSRISQLKELCQRHPRFCYQIIWLQVVLKGENWQKLWLNSRIRSQAKGSRPSKCFGKSWDSEKWQTTKTTNNENNKQQKHQTTKTTNNKQWQTTNNYKHRQTTKWKNDELQIMIIEKQEKTPNKKQQLMTKNDKQQPITNDRQQQMTNSK